MAGLALLACARGSDGGGCTGEIAPGARLSCSAPGDAARPYTLVLPGDLPAGRAVPLLLVLHGGGGRPESAETMTCPDGRADHPDCLANLGRREGFASVFPSGVSGPHFARLRTWNAGGGVGDWQCVSGAACREGSDDVAYLRRVVADVAGRLPVDRRRIYAAGLSNGAAMSHRLACEAADLFAAIVAVGGGNQLAAAQGCAPVRPVAVLQVHGSADPCWPYEGGTGSCLQRDGKRKVGVAETLAGWATRNGCGAPPREEALPDLADDGMRTTRIRWPGCRAGGDVVLLRIEGGGHAWPDGHQYLPARLVGRPTRDFGNSLLWRFLADHPMRASEAP